MRDETDKQRQDLKVRTKQFALRIIRLYAALPVKAVAQVLGKQVLRSGTSVGAHNREAFRSRSDAEFISKLARRSVAGAGRDRILAGVARGRRGHCRQALDF